MAQVILVTGGSRSGKSRFAEATALAVAGRRAYIATAPVCDAEMAARVAEHRRRRNGAGWDTIEEPLALADAIRAATGRYEVILVDCLTLWLNNLLYRAETDPAAGAFTEAATAAACRELEAACREFAGTVVFVISEVGCGIVPESPAARLFRDCSGRCAQAVAAFADRVFLVSCGLPLLLKSSGSDG
ncbi:MAG: bifunctional adenosylcobinamide kinase/adenosylcobinamide-phosphate guanylyltransferase [Victivallales bacterium]|nr:bifunctional adenosylcobinamide kinase/adenosylcobinamide-phosphate guanylyltransferase [Victivallales bacterium]